MNNGRLPSLLYSGQISNEPNWSFPSHKPDDFCEVIYVQRGEGILKINNREYGSRQGDIVIFNPGVLHEEKPNPQNELHTYFCGIGNLHIRGMKPGHLISDNMEPIIHANKYVYKIESYISDIFKECTSQVIGYETVSETLLSSLIVLILRIIQTEHPYCNTRITPSSRPLARQIQEYIDLNYTHFTSISDVANRFYISPDYLSHIFKEGTGKSLISYVINRRLGHAKTLLLTTRVFKISLRWSDIKMQIILASCLKRCLESPLHNFESEFWDE
ncbi:AraC family transcriptional regulator [Alicyclobacillus fastidiosus]|uniref:AraC family transcriptional regulator n=1 Tax=Alicyclobacillus fastidiosus TaxID=392011 RepID=A0ABY6ZCC8_9BACL|nr:AraC family transcriptional regulator [Alicyclobacillus fastidiosus]WAH39854.1 AraC family transcriptional regulator [Alicyclobacillus fastidiosus]GMA61118.1 hypothetical protein GCM10025859_15580 [Alicyclobacillus fastidiosus]